MPERVLILAPRGRDAAIAAELLDRHDIGADVCADQAALLDQLRAGAGAVMLTEEALLASDMADLAAWVAGQPAWADIPFVVLANGVRAPRSAAATRRLGELGNVVLLERPLHAEAMLGAVRSALKARSRQYEVRDAAGKLERAVVDRTRELEAARESLEIALDAAGMGSWDIDLPTGTARRTLRHDQIFGYAQALPDWDVEAFLKHVEPAQRDMVSEAFAVAPTTGALDIECGIVAADGSRRWIVAKGRVRYDENGVPVRITGVVSDVTDRKDADAQLAQAQKMDAIGQLTGGVAHDFNNLLTPIVGSLDLVRRRHKDDERTQRMIGGALQAAERAATLTQRLLSFARRQALQPRSVDIGALIDGIVDLIRRSLGPSIAVALEVPRHLSSARVDPNQLELALLNLAINARDAMPGGGTICIEGQYHPAANDNAPPGNEHVVLLVRDDGYGMPQEILSRATEPFFTTKGPGKGTGLGLSMAHGLAEQSGGHLEIRSTPGEGTAIELWLPVAKPQERAEDKSTWAAASPWTRTAAKASLTVLVVDDDPLVLENTSALLEDLGYRVTAVDNCEAALCLLRRQDDFDILVTDHMMPGMTGAQLAETIRTERPGLPVLLVSGYADLAEGNRRLHTLAKPLNQASLVHAMNQAMNRPESGVVVELYPSH